MKLHLPLLIAVFFAACIPATGLSQALAGSDVNADGSSDFTLITIGGDSNLSWGSYSASGVPIDGSQLTLGQSGNHIVLGNWSSVSKAQRGILSLNGQQVLWTIVPQNGVPVAKNLGAQKDTLISGGDFNGNGYADAAFIRKPRAGEPLYNL